MVEVSLRSRQSRWAVVALVGVTAVWGSTFVVVQYAVETLPVNDFLFWRFIIAGLLLLALRPRSLSRVDGRDLRRGALLGAVLVCAVGFAAHLVFLGEWTTPAKAYPLSVVQLLTASVLTGVAGDSVTLRTAIGGGLILAAMYLVELRGRVDQARAAPNLRSA